MISEDREMAAVGDGEAAGIWRAGGSGRMAGHGWKAPELCWRTAAEFLDAGVPLDGNLGLVCGKPAIRDDAEKIPR